MGHKKRGFFLNRLNYVLQRVGRNLLPERVATLGRRLRGDIPGGESASPEIFANHYVETLAKFQRSFDGARILVFGHGPSYGFACYLLAAGARHVFLFDPYAQPDDRANAEWLRKFPDYLERREGRIRPRSQWMTTVPSERVEAENLLPRADIAVSTSVFEHLDQVDFWTRELARCTAPDGFNVHMIDLRDHFFDLPFEMLSYSVDSWRRWLNPRQNLNRWRLKDYAAVFHRHFREMSIDVLEREREAFQAARKRIRSEFLTGEDEVDSVTEIEVCAAEPVTSD